MVLKRKTGFKRQVAVIVVVLGSLWFLSWCAAKWLIVSSPPYRGDAIVMLSGSSSIHERVERAATLYREHSAAKVILTDDHQQGGWNAEEQRNPYSFEVARRELVWLGVNANDIDVIPGVVNSTYDEAMAVREYSKRKNMHSLVLVTSAYHSRRALRVFRHAFADTPIEIGSGPAAPGWQTPRPSAWWLSLRGWQLVGGEYLKLLSFELQ
jgi:uncharacterized SAM-binding protein YcdF (DUF218 family)